MSVKTVRGNSRNRYFPAGYVFLIQALLSLLPATAADLNVPGDYSTIQGAIDAAEDGDTVSVTPGTYVENLELKSGIDVRGDEAARTFIEPDNLTDPAVLADKVDDVLFANFTIRKSQIAFDVIDSTNLKIANTVIDGAEQIGLQVNIDSQVDVLNSVFWNNTTAIRRSTEDVQVTNSGFIGNTGTILSPIAPIIDPNINVDNCGFFDNEDLKISGVDTGLGTDPVVGDPQFVSSDAYDFHLLQGSPFIDVGLGTDVIDNSTADIGAYGGTFADVRPLPVDAPSVTDNSGASPPPYSISLNWSKNSDYRITNTMTPGSYRVYYRQNQSGPPYDGTDAGNGAQPSPVDAGDKTNLTLTDLQPVVMNVSVPLLLSVEPRSSSVKLIWEAVTDATDYRVHYGTTSINENSIDTGDVTSFSVGGLQNGTEYHFAVIARAQPVYHFAITAVDNSQNQYESEFSPESTLAIGSAVESMPSNELTATPDDTTPFPDLPDKGCFVATAAFGVDWSAEVRILRDFRDRFLVTNRAGRMLVRWYYRNGPSAAALIREHDAVRPYVRVLLWPLIAFALIALAATPVETIALVMLCLILVGMWVIRGFRAFTARSFQC